MLIVTLFVLALVAQEEPAEPSQAAERPDVEKLLARWQESTAVETLDVAIAVRELTKEGTWVSEEPISARFRFQAEPLDARFDVGKEGPTSYFITHDAESIVLPATGEPKRARLHVNDFHRAKLWLGDLPAFLLVGVDPAKMKYRFEIRAVSTGENAVTMLLYPQVWADEKRFVRLEVQLHKQTAQVASIHVLWRDGRHSYIALQDPKSDVALGPNVFDVK